ncbi:MAG: hypothetical protein E3J72_13815 [Planctomycetota bacterium]|nr:MAG: hypothetical protein E3J72_13815 [Planctomycetota bacterium]
MSRLQCDECGCHAMAQREVGGHVFIECQVCGMQIGNDDFFDTIDFNAWAERNKIEPASRECVRALNSIEGFETYSSCGGHPDEGLPPYVYFTTTTRAQRFIPRVVELLEMIRRDTACRWILEVTARKGLSFWLRPLFPLLSRHLSADEVQRARKDLRTIAAALVKHSRLAWWYRND